MANMNPPENFSQELQEGSVQLYSYNWGISNFTMMLPFSKIKGPVLPVGALHNIEMNMFLEMTSNDAYVISLQFESDTLLRGSLEELAAHFFILDSKKNIVRYLLLAIIRKEELYANSLCVYLVCDNIIPYVQNSTLYLGTLVAVKSCNNLFSRDTVTSEIRKISEDLEKLLTTERVFSDVTVRSGDKEFHLHKFLLYNRCPLLENLSLNFSSAINENDSDGKLIITTHPHPLITFKRNCVSTIIELKEEFSDVLLPILYYIYCNKIMSLNVEMYFKFFHEANKLQLKDLCMHLFPIAITQESSIKTIRTCCEFEIKNYSSHLDGDILSTFFLVTPLRETVKWQTQLIAYFGYGAIEIVFRKLSKTNFTIVTEICMSSLLERDKHVMGKINEIFLGDTTSEGDDDANKASTAFLVQTRHVCNDRLTVRLNFAISDGQFSPGSLITSVKHEEKLGLTDLFMDMSKLYNTRKFSDFTIRMPYFSTSVHRALLSVRSPALADAALRGPRSTENSVDISDERASVETVELLLKYIYTGEIDNLNMNNVWGLYNAANMYEMRELRALCRTFLSRNMNR